MQRDQLKRKLKELRQSEIAIRFKNRQAPNGSEGLVWGEFFSTKSAGVGAARPVRFTLEALEQMSREQLSEVFSDYICFVYFQYYKEMGIPLNNGRGYDPHLLAQMGLSPLATDEDVKKRFRELARKYHPDTGGDRNQFVAMMDVYNRLKTQ
ncbi:MAG TPA: DnaJ domain-containing protein [Anaerolineae bacterium]|jgi:hypothetical protein